MLCGATACWLGLHSLSQTLCCREAGSNEWCEGWVVRGQRRKGSFYQSRDANRAARSSPRTVEAARRPRFVSTARRAPGEDRALRSIACRHQDSRESSGEDELAPRGVRPPTPSSGSGPARSPKMGPRAYAAWRQFVLVGRALALLMPTDDAPQGPILAWCAACRRNEPRPPRGLDRARARSGAHFASRL